MNIGNESSRISDGDKIIFSKRSGRTRSRLMSNVEDDVSINRDNCSSQEVENDFSSVIIKCEEPEMSDSDTSNNEMDSKPQILNTVNTNEQLGLVVNIKPEPFEIESRVKQEFVSNQETGPIDVAIKYEKTEMCCSDTMLFSEGTIDTKEQFDFNASNANTAVKCDPLATETYIKQENEVYYVCPSFSTFSYGNGDTDDKSSDQFVSVNGKCENKTTFRCDVCNNAFTRRETLTNHKLTHTGERPYQCDICNKYFTQRSSLRIHKRLHSGEKPYQCDICSKTFDRSLRLTEHKRTHTGERPYQCDICNKTFVRLRQFTDHKRTHTGERPYQCDICNKCFIQPYSLTVHKRLHSGEKPYQCDVCDRSFTQSCNLQRHKLTHF